MNERLTQANVRQEDGPLAEVESLLKTLGEAWQSIRRGRAATAEIGPDREVSINRSSLAFIDSATSQWSG